MLSCRGLSRLVCRGVGMRDCRGAGIPNAGLKGFWLASVPRKLGFIRLQVGWVARV